MGDIVNACKRLGFVVGMCLLAFIIAPAWSVIILDSTFKQSGFKKAEALALAPQFASLIYLKSDLVCGSGSWIGNYAGHGYVLTAGHMFPEGRKANAFSYLTINGREYKGDAVYLHPLWNENNDERTGFDFAIVRLNKEVTGAGDQPALYDGTDEQGKMLTFIGYGWRGTGVKGEDTSIDTEDKPAAAVGLIEFVENAVTPLPTKGDAGSYFGVWLPKEDGSMPNPLDEEGIQKPVSPLSGILGSGDSGGPAWIETKNGWAIAGINSDGSGNAAYGDVSWFPRVSYVRAWIEEVMPKVRFIR
ncbi:Trypsin [Legionella shakespearei DSM 23087]|uniref:Trypsin n=1 Tax=Legionella shakespearei DSM 23087 TaxID=1122169 RepID=A0A0W0YMV3_9GAMM|nr:Trypsin [Legionella shakespearei DSM 23087]